MQQRTFRAEVHDESVDFAVVVIVGKAGAASHRALAEHRAGIARNVFEFPVGEPAKQRVLLRDEMNETAVKDEDV